MTFDDDPHRAGGVRASDAEREQVADALRRNHGEGRLGDDDLDTRLEACYHARTVAQLHRLLSDLPEGRPAQSGWPAGRAGWLGRAGGPGAGGLDGLRHGLPWPPVLVVLALVGVLSLLGGWMWGGPSGAYHHHPPLILPLLVAFVVWRLVQRRRRMTSGASRR
jgi:hypothetical protein